LRAAPALVTQWELQNGIAKKQRRGRERAEAFLAKAASLSAFLSFARRKVSRATSMEDAFDPFGLDEAESALQVQQQVTTHHGTAPDASSNSPDQVAGFDAGDDGDAFDPFGIGKEPAPATTKRNILSPPSKEDINDSGEESPPEPPAVSRILARSTFRKATSVAALTPKMHVKLSIHEEVSSKAYDGDGASDV